MLSCEWLCVNRSYKVQKKYGHTFQVSSLKSSTLSSVASLDSAFLVSIVFKQLLHLNRTGGQLSSPKSAGTQVQLGRRSCFYFRAWESRLAVLCEYTKWLTWFLAVCTVCTQYTLLAQAKLVLSSSAVQRIAYSAQYTQTGSSTLAQDKFNLPRQG